MRLIDADKLAERMKDWGKSFYDFNVELALGCLMDEPTIDLWHYPSKGELPEKDGEYLCRYYKYDLRFSKLAHYRVEDNKWYHLIYDEEYRMPKPDAWQYIVPPKKEE